VSRAAGVTDGAGAGARYDALGHAFEFRSEDPALQRHAEAALVTLAGGGGTAHRYVHTVADEGHGLWRDGTRLAPPLTPGLVLPTLLWHVNRAAASCADKVLLHAAAAAGADGAVLLAGASGAGKSTLVTGLVQAGLDYLTDEIVAVDPATGRIAAYPKPLTLKPGAWRLFPLLEPRGAGLAPYLARQWQVSATAVRPAAVSACAAPRLVAVVRYAPRAETCLAPLRPAQALLALSEHLLGDSPRRRDVETLAELVTAGSCVRLTVGRLGDAVRLLVNALGEATELSA
jgi:hypothetical protein